MPKRFSDTLPAGGRPLLRSPVMEKVLPLVRESLCAGDSVLLISNFLGIVSADSASLLLPIMQSAAKHYTHPRAGFPFLISGEK
jgi:hypothetical protein